MNNGWIKLHRKINDKGLMKDHLAFILFSWLLVNVDKDGSKKLGRYTVCDELGINPNTYYKVLKRLEKKWGVIRVQSTKSYSTVWIVKWLQYQHQENARDNQPTTSGESAENEKTTIQEYKNKEYKNIEYIKNFPIEDFSDLDGTEKQLRLEAEQALNWLLQEGKKKSNYRAFLRKWFTGTYGKFKKKVVLENMPIYEIDAQGLARLTDLKKNSLVMKGMN